MIKAVRILLLLITWLALWSDVSAANVVSGVLVAAVIVTAFDTWRDGTVVVRPVHAAKFALHFVRNLFEASLVVARTAITPRDRVNTGIVAVPLHGCSEALATLIADAISLTPGTLTFEVRRNPLTLYVHALDVRDVEQVRADVRRLELLAVSAFGPRAAIADLRVDDTEAWRGG